MDSYLYLGKAIIVVAEFIAAITGIVHFKRMKSQVWKLFVYYLVFIFLQEFYFFFNDNLLSIRKPIYYAFIGMPVQILFFYWLIAFNSLKKKYLFYLFLLVYLVSIPFEYFLKEIEIVFSFSFTVGTLLLSFLIVLEFVKQIRSDEILYFKENKMFYVMVGIIFTYIGTYPYIAFHKELYMNHFKIWSIYHIYFVISNAAMYLLFAISFIWTRQS